MPHFPPEYVCMMSQCEIMNMDVMLTQAYSPLFTTADNIPKYYICSLSALFPIGQISECLVSLSQIGKKRRDNLEGQRLVKK